MIRRPPRSTLSSCRQRQMFIRDSDGTNLRHIGGHVAGRRQCSHSDESAQCCPREARPVSDMSCDMYLRSVSYTHLRAHETPEHLVCRLLLEKKKQTNTSLI
eukprot:TRINITY_DN19216_c0_g1_i1.p1 TRINITY_DN19216_c0_g1~~TRINITY_DN19216_c0_g1_i1.p1  ORF type:complete len:102 (-),score=13.90 TRINITY_DN19216_c0_g1_i1:64-369(-)